MPTADATAGARGRVLATNAAPRAVARGSSGGSSGVRAPRQAPKTKTRAAMAAPFLAFDLEFAGTEPLTAALLCAASCGSHDVPRLWRASTWGAPMAPLDVDALVEYLWAAHARGTTLVTWGGVASDWRVLAARCSGGSTAARVRAMAVASVDLPLAAAATSGCLVGLAAAASAAGLRHKAPTASAAVPALWAAGHCAAVLDHVLADASTTAVVYAHLLHASVASAAATAAVAAPPVLAAAAAGGGGGGGGGGGTKYAAPGSVDATSPPAASSVAAVCELAWHTRRGRTARCRLPCAVTPRGLRIASVAECVAHHAAHPPAVHPPPGLSADAMAAWLG